MAVSSFDVEDFLDAYSEHDTVEEYLDDPDIAYVEDALSEWADSQVPIYTVDAVQEWLALGCPEVDDPGLVEGVTDVARIIRTVLFEHYSYEAYRGAQEAGLI